MRHPVYGAHISHHGRTSGRDRPHRARAFLRRRSHDAQPRVHDRASCRSSVVVDRRRLRPAQARRRRNARGPQDHAARVARGHDTGRASSATGTKLTRRAAVGLLGLLAAPSIVRAQAEYPNRLIKLIVPFAAGGSTDLVARFIAERMRDRLGQTIVVENCPGANAIVGTQFTAKSAPDGYTLQLGGVSTHAINPHLRKNATLRRHQGLHLARPDRDGTAGRLGEPERSGQDPSGADHLREGKSDRARLRFLRRRHPAPWRRAAEKHGGVRDASTCPTAATDRL